MSLSNYPSHFSPLLNKTVTLGVCASIAIYKALEIIRILQKMGAKVLVVMTPSATRMINPLVFEALSGNKVLSDETQDWVSSVQHISFARVDAFIIAPATANSINKLANGIADNVLLQSFLASCAKKLVAPAANASMLDNPITQKSLANLQENGITLISPAEKVLVCKEVGSGALASPFEIAMQTARAILKQDFWENRCVCINGGGSRERLDSVRYISNFSSGKQASSLAVWAYLLGGEVTFISSVYPYSLPLGIKTQNVSSTKDYLKATVQWKNSHFGSKKPCFFGVAAISDYTLANPPNFKLKKENLGNHWNVQLELNADILKSLEDFCGYKIGFKLENMTDNNLQQAILNAQQSRMDKKLYAVCLNVISEFKNPFNAVENEIFWCDERGASSLGAMDKFSLAQCILKKVEND